MKNFRVAKCVIDSEIKNFAIFDDGNKKQIIHSDEFGDYFYVDNELNPNGGILSKFFTDRISDAIETIRNGNGDAVQNSTGFFNFTFTKVCYFIDRTIGEKMRTQTLNGFKDTKFGWAAKTWNKNAFSSFFVGENGTRLSMFDKPSMIKVFDSEQDVNTYMEEIVKKAFDNLPKYIEDSKKANLEDVDLLVEIAGGDKQFWKYVIFEYLDDMAENNATEPKLTDMNYKPVQVVIIDDEKQEKTA